MSAARFLWWVISSTVLTLALAVGLNRLINPYWMFGGPVIAGLNDVNPLIHLHTRMWKARAIKTGRYQAIALGSSRVEQGLDPEHPGWGDRRVFNLGIPSANIYELRRYFQHALATAGPELVVLGMDFELFFSSEPVQQDFAESRLCRVGGRCPGTEDLIRVLLSISALKDSLALMQATGAGAYPYFRNGMRDPAGMERLLVDSAGQVKRFERMLASKRQELDAQEHDPRALNLEEFELLLREAHAAAIDLRLFLSPNHALLTTTIERSGLRPLMESWVTELTRINETVAHESRRAPYPLWDFSGYNRYTTEPLPEPGGGFMRWHWEASHYRKELGDRVLDCVLGGTGCDWGRLLATGNVRAHFGEQRRLALEYQARFGDRATMSSSEAGS